MSWLEIALLCGLFASTFLVQIRLPIQALSANNLIVPIFALALVCLSRASLGATARRHRNLLLATGVVYVWVWIASLNSLMPAASVRFAFKCTAYPVLGFCFLLLFEHPTARWPAVRTVYLILATLAALGILEYWWPDFPFVALRGHLATYPRVASLFLWPNQFGVFMAIGLTLGAALRHAGQLRPLFFRTPLPLFLIALALSGSRNGWFVFVLLLLILFAVHLIRLAELVCIGLVWVLLLLTLPVPRAQLGLEPRASIPLPQFLESEVPHDLSTLVSPTQTLIPRLQLWHAALREIRQHPLTGIGPEVFSNSIGPAITGQKGINTHNLVLNIATEIGLVGLALLAFWSRLLLRSGDPRHWATSLPLLGIGLGQVFDCFTYDYAFMTFSLFFIAAYASGPRDRH